jgi:hypothetical protein
VTSPETGAAVEEAVSAAASVEAVSAAASVEAVVAAASVEAVSAAVVDALVEELDEPQPASTPADITQAARILSVFLVFIMIFPPGHTAVFVCVSY